MNVKRVSMVYGAVAYPVLGLMFFGAAGTVRWLAGWTRGTDDDRQEPAAVGPGVW